MFVYVENEALKGFWLIAWGNAPGGEEDEETRL